MDCGGWALIYDPGQKRLMLLVELGGSTWGSNVYQTVRSLFVKADHPVPQRLAVHTTSFRRLFPRCSVEDRSDRQKPTCLRKHVGFWRSLRSSTEHRGKRRRKLVVWTARRCGTG